MAAGSVVYCRFNKSRYQRSNAHNIDLPLVSMLRTPSQRTANAAVLALLAAAVVALLYGPLIEGKALYFRDLQIFFIPLKQFLADSLRHGVIPFWNPNVSLGTPFFAEMQTGVLYPPSWLLALVDGTRGIALILAFHLWLAAAGAYLFARSLQLSVPAALLSAASYALGGCLLSSLNMINFMQGLAWLPLVLWAFERDTLQPTRRSWVVAALAVALQTLAGAPDVCIMTGLIVAGRQLVLNCGRRWQWLLRVGAAYALALLVTAPQLMATYELYRHSVRTAGLSAAEIQSYSLHYGELLSLVWPPALSAWDWNIFAVFPDGYVPLFLSLYLGWSALLLVACAVWWQGRRTVFWWLLGGVGVFLALGGNNPAAMWIYQTVAIFRYPEKYVVLLHVALAVMVGLGAQALLDFARQRGWRPALLGLSLGAVLIAELVLVNRHINLQEDADYYQLASLPEVRLLSQRPPGYVYTRPARQADTNSVRALYGEYRRRLLPHIGTLAGLRYVQGTEGLTLKEHTLVSELLDTIPPSDMLADRLAFFDAPYVVSAQTLFEHSRTWRETAQRLTPLLWQVPLAKPPVYFPTTVLNKEPGFIYRAVDDLDFTQGHSAFVSTPGQNDVSGLRAHLESAHRVSPNRMEMTVAAETRAFLVWSESFYPGWQVSVDGREQPLVRANYLFMGVWLPPGRHRVVFDFTPTGFYWGLGISGLALLLLALVYGWRPRPRPSNPSDEPARL
jgi:hypothetical protein